MVQERNACSLGDEHMRGDDFLPCDAVSFLPITVGIINHQGGNQRSTACSLLFACLLLPFLAGVSVAQDRSPFRLGGTFGVSADFHRTEGIRFADNEPGTPLLGNTTGYTGRMGFVAEYRLNEVWGLNAHLDYASGSALFMRTSETPGPYEVEFLAAGTFPSQSVSIDPNDPRADAEYEYHA